MDGDLKLGLIGAGRIGRVHAHTLARAVPGVGLAAIADVRLEAAQELARQYDVPVAVQDHLAILADPEIDAVVICTSTDTHADLIVEAARAGKHVFCEKPIALDLVETDRALAAATEAGVKLQIGFNRRFDPSFRRVRDLVAQGRVGEPHIVHIISRDPAPPPIEYVKVSGGIFVDMTIHDFDMARFLTGSDIEEVTAVGAVLVDPAVGEAGDVDTALVTLRFVSGALGSIDNSRRAVYGYDQRVEVFGSRGSAAAGNQTPTNTVVADAEGIHQEKPLYFFLERYASAYVAELQAFCDCLRQDVPPPVTGADGRAALVAALAATRSLREHRPVRVAEVEGG
ncbi:MAG: inositol 2-dehydrogenase [Anaerolineae bacterium]|nr:inositol 2-dehydrogenase [Anaerolineae bacterium]